jgi:tetratricopeptide (TPR) repeat protein
MSGERDFIGNFVPKSRFITAATQTGVQVSNRVKVLKRVFFQKDDLGKDCKYVETGCNKILNNGVLYTDEISWCLGLALWSPGRAGLFHITPGTRIEDIEAFLKRYANGSKALPQLVFGATWPEHTPSGFHNDNQARDSSLYAALRALLNYYGPSIKRVTIIITGFRGRRWSHEAQLAVSAVEGVLMAIPGREEKDQAQDLAEAEEEVKRLESSFGLNSPTVLAAVGNLALVYYKQGDYRRAEIMFKTLLSDTERVLGPEHPQVATNLHNLGLLYGNQEHYEDAEALFKRALSIWEREPEHRNVATCKKNYALLLEKKREAKARKSRANRQL